MQHPAWRQCHAHAAAHAVHQRQVFKLSAAQTRVRHQAKSAVVFAPARAPKPNVAAQTDYAASRRKAASTPRQRSQR